MSGGALALGPRPLDRAARRDRLRAVVARLCEATPAAAGVALYGSAARGSDGPCSDLELLCVDDAATRHRALEWIDGELKVKVHVYPERELRADARAVTAEWALHRSRYLHAEVLREARPIFGALRELACAATDEELGAAMRALFVAEIYEGIGKARNAIAAGRGGALPALACRMAEAGALLVGLGARACFSSRHLLLEEAAALPGRPEGLGALCRVVTEGRLASPAEVGVALERLYADLLGWARERGADPEAALVWPIEEGSGA